MDNEINTDVAYVVNKLILSVEKLIEPKPHEKTSDNRVMSSRKIYSHPDNGHLKIKGTAIRNCNSFSASNRKVPPILPKNKQQIQPRPLLSSKDKSLLQNGDNTQQKKFFTPKLDGQRNAIVNNVPNQLFQNAGSNSECSIANSVDTVIARMSAATNLESGSGCSIQFYSRSKKATTSRLKQENSIINSTNKPLINSSRSKPTHQEPNVSSNIIVSPANIIVSPAISNQLALLGPNVNIISAGTGNFQHYYIKSTAPIPSNGTQLIPMIHPALSINSQPVMKLNSEISTDSMEQKQQQNLKKNTNVILSDNKHKFIQPKPKITTNGNSTKHIIHVAMSKNDKQDDMQPVDFISINSTKNEYIVYKEPESAKRQMLQQRAQYTKHPNDKIESIPSLSDNSHHSSIVEIEDKKEDEEENEPPPLLMRDEMGSIHYGNSFIKQASMMREQIFSSENVQLSLKHELGGFIIEENSEPFPCEHKNLLKNLFRTQNEVANRFSFPNTNGKRNVILSSSDDDLTYVFDANKRPRGTKKGRKREVEALLNMDFGKNTPFQNTQIDEYMKEVLIEQRHRTAYKAVTRRSPESIESDNTISKKIRSRQRKRHFSPSQSAQRPSSSRSTSKEVFAYPDSQKTHRKKLNNSKSFSSQKSPNETEGGELCLGCDKVFSKPRDRDTLNPQYCSKECRRKYKRTKNGDLSTHENFRSVVRTSQDDKSREQPTKFYISGSQKRKPVITLHAKKNSIGNTSNLSPAGSISKTPSATAFLSPPQNERSGGDSNPQNNLAFQQSPPMAPIPSLPHIPQSPSNSYNPASSNFGGPQFFNTFDSLHGPLINPMMAAASNIATSFQQQCSQQLFSTQSAFIHQQPTASSIVVMPPQNLPSTYVGYPPSTSTMNTDKLSEMESLMSKGVYNWTPEDVAQWANIVTGSETNGVRFIHQEIDGASLILLTKDQLQNELEFKLGPLVKLTNALLSLKSSLNL